MLSELEITLCSTMSWRLHRIFGQHLLALTIAGTSTACATARYGETIWKYVMDMFQWDQHTRMCYAEAHVRVERSRVSAYVAANRTLLSLVRATTVGKERANLCCICNGQARHMAKRESKSNAIG